MDVTPPTWLDAVRLLHEAGQDGAARAVLDTAAQAYPADIRPMVGRVELAALADDYIAGRYAMQDLTRRGAGDALTACLTDDPEIAFRLAQLWVVMDGRDRRSRFWLSRCLGRMGWFVPPVPSGLTPEAYAEAVAPALARRTQDAPHPADALALWRDWLDPTDGPEMRGEVMVTQAGAHLQSLWGSARLLAHYAQAAQEARAGDRLGLLELFADDGAFGALRFRLADGSIISQDQLTSVQDINLLARWVGFGRADAPLLIDIGAGYGRMTHRFLQAMPSSHALALDAVPGTSAMAEHYLANRGCQARAVTGGPRRLLGALPPGQPRIAVNIQSWSEAPLASIEAWLELLSVAEADWLLVATHDKSAVSFEVEGPPRAMLPAFDAAGWTLVEERPRYTVLPASSGHLWMFRRG